MMHGYIGASGAGKTWTMQSHADGCVRAGWHLVVMDLVAEWPNEKAWKGRPRFVQTDDIRAAVVAMQTRPLVVYRPPRGMHGDYAQLADELCGAAIDGPPTVVCLPEAQHACREHRPLHENVGEIVHRWRHQSVGARIWWDTQQLADVSKELYAASTRLHCFGGAHRRDGGRIRALGKEPLLEAVDECGRRALNGQPGWHAAIRPLEPRAPRYPLSRA